MSVDFEKQLVDQNFRKFVMAAADQSGFTLGMSDDLGRLLDVVALKAGVQPKDIRILVLTDERTGKPKLELVGRDTSKGIMGWLPLDRLREQNHRGTDPSLLVDTAHGAWDEIHRREEERRAQQ